MKQPRVRILAVGLDEEDQGILREVFSRFGWILVTAGTIAEAVRSLEHYPAPVILCESDLPDGNWADVVEVGTTRERPSNVIVTSRLADDRLWADVLNLGGYDVLAKPLASGELFRAVGSALRNSHNVKIMQQEKSSRSTVLV